MAAGGSLNGFTGEVFDKANIGSGVLIMNPVDEDYETLVAAARGDEMAGTKLGATTGGVTFSPEIEEVNLGENVDGFNVDLKGAMQIEKISATLETSLVEQTPGVIKAIKPFTDMTTNEDGSVTYDPRPWVNDDDYIDLIVLLCQGKDIPLKLAIYFYNALALEGGSIETPESASELYGIPVTWTCMSADNRFDEDFGIYRPGYKWRDFSDYAPPETATTAGTGASRATTSSASSATTGSAVSAPSAES